MSSEFDLDIDLDSIRSTLEEKESERGFTVDPSRFNPANQMKDGTVAIVRVLPTIDNKWYNVEHTYHQVNGKGKMYTCPKSLDKEDSCPFCEKASGFFDKNMKDTAMKFYKKKRYASYVRVKNSDELGLTELSEPTLWWYGKKVNGKFESAIKDDEIGAFFHPITGRDFKLRKTTVDNNPNYDESSFSMSVTKLHDNDKIIKAYYNARTDLNDEIDTPLSYEDLEKIMNGGNSGDSEVSEDEIKNAGSVSRLPKKDKVEEKVDTSSDDNEDDDELAMLMAKINGK